MNRPRLQGLIDALKRAQKRGDALNMRNWQTTYAPEIVTSEEHTCGTICCVAGWLAISKEFQEAGGTCTATLGEPRFDGVYGRKALGRYLHIHNGLATEITATGNRFISAQFYGVESIDDVTLPVVIARLETLLETGR